MKLLFLLHRMNVPGSSHAVSQPPRRHLRRGTVVVQALVHMLHRPGHRQHLLKGAKVFALCHGAAQFHTI